MEGGHALDVGQVPLDIGRSTWTAGDTRVSRLVCRVSLAESSFVLLEACRDLRYRPSPAPADFVPLRKGESARLSHGAEVELLGCSPPLVFRVERVPQKVSLPSPSSPSSSSLSSGGGAWLRVSKKSAPSPSAVVAVATPTPTAAAPELKRARIEPASPSPRHVCSGRMRGTGLFFADFLSVRPEFEGGLNRDFHAHLEIGTDVLSCSEGSFGDKAAFWISRAWDRGLVCAVEAFGLDEIPSKGQLSCALELRQCEKAGNRDLLECFLEGAFDLKASVAECVGFADESRKFVEFQGSETEQNLSKMFSQLATTCDPAPQPAAVATAMKKHQLQALQWMLNREIWQADAVPPFWEERNTFGPRPWRPDNARAWGKVHVRSVFTFMLVVQRFNCGRPFFSRFQKVLLPMIVSLVPTQTSYYHTLTNVETKRRPQSAKGGILADDMGLGKTLTVIGLIASNGAVEWTPSERTNQELNYDSFYDSLMGEKKTMADESLPPPPNDLQRLPSRIVPFPDRRPTLIVCPMSCLENWESQLQLHLGGGGNVCRTTTYHGSKKIKDAAILAEHDVVLTTYMTLVGDFAGDDPAQRGPLSRVKWRRLVLDEAHVCRNPTSSAFRRAMMVDRIYTWAVTATPLQNKPLDLFPLFALINEEVFSDRISFGRLITTPILRAEANGFLRLRRLMMNACLRRTKESQTEDGKDLVSLPKLTVHDVRLLQSEKENLLYRAFDTQALELFEELQKWVWKLFAPSFGFWLWLFFDCANCATILLFAKTLKLFSPKQRMLLSLTRPRERFSQQRRRRRLVAACAT